jgi:hypothetical protein
MDSRSSCVSLSGASGCVLGWIRCVHTVGGWIKLLVWLGHASTRDPQIVAVLHVIGFPAQLSGLFSPSGYHATHRDLFFKLMPRVRVATFFPPPPPPTPTTLPLPPRPPPLATCGRGGTPTAPSPTVEHASAPKPPLYSREDHRRHPQDNPQTTSTQPPPPPSVVNYHAPPPAPPIRFGEHH